MKPGDTIETQDLLLRGWMPETDGDAFFRLFSDPTIMAFFPQRRDRPQADALLNNMPDMITRDGYGWSAIVRRDTGQVIGFGGLAKTGEDMPFPVTTEIGWRLVPEEWHKGLATQAASAFRDYAFKTLKLPEIASFCVHNNAASEAVMKRIGMNREASLDFDHPRIPDTHPHLKRHIVYRLTRSDWENKKGG